MSESIEVKVVITKPEDGLETLMQANRQAPRTLAQAGQEFNEALGQLWFEIVRALHIEAIVRFCDQWLQRVADR